MVLASTTARSALARRHRPRGPVLWEAACNQVWRHGGPCWKCDGCAPSKVSSASQPWPLPLTATLRAVSFEADQAAQVLPDPDVTVAPIVASTAPTSPGARSSSNGIPVLPARRLPSMLRALPTVLGPERVADLANRAQGSFPRRRLTLPTLTGARQLHRHLDPYHSSCGRSRSTSLVSAAASQDRPAGTTLLDQPPHRSLYRRNGRNWPSNTTASTISATPPASGRLYAGSPHSGHDRSPPGGSP
jgi:hypothetical protein